MNIYCLLEENCISALTKVPENSVHAVITSPPYYPCIRDYGVKKVNWKTGWYGVLGWEPNPQMYIDHLLEVFTEVFRVLRPDGSLWVNIGDTYAKNNKWKKEFGIKSCDLIGTPRILALSLRKIGFYLRNDNICEKLGVMPESVKTRCSRCHEYVFHLSKKKTPYFDHLAIREPASESSLKRIHQSTFNNQHGGEKDYARTGINPNRSARRILENFAKNPGRNKRSVWHIPTARSRNTHFAVFPEQLPKLCIRAATSEKGCCSDCGAPWVRVTSAKRIPTRPGEKNKEDPTKLSYRDPQRHCTIYQTLGWEKSCSCETNNVRPCVVMDVFSGSGTTGVVSSMCNRNYIGIEMNAEYNDIARKRIAAIDDIFVEETTDIKDVYSGDY